MAGPFKLEHILKEGIETHPWGEIPAAWAAYCQSRGTQASDDISQAKGWHFPVEWKYSWLKIPLWFSVTPRVEGKSVKELPNGIARWLGFFDNANDTTLYLAERLWLNYDLSAFCPKEDTDKPNANPLDILRDEQEKSQDHKNPLKHFVVRDASGHRCRACRLLADFWIYPRRDSRPEEAICVITGRKGIAVYLPELDDGSEITEKGAIISPEPSKKKDPHKRVGPPFPLIGLRALQLAKLELNISCKTSPGIVTFSA
jgi:hypothetical protein